MYKAKKSLGQNFLKSAAIVGRIAKASNIKEGGMVLEIGPGKGILTKALLLTGAIVVAVEKDMNLIPNLLEKFKNEINEKRLFLINADILDISIVEIFSIHSPLITSHYYKLVANIPYYITGEILRKFLESKFQPQSMVVLVQKEVAKRIVATDKKESILSLSVKAYGEPRYIETVKRKMFSPSPNVDSAILLIDKISKSFFEKNGISEEQFFKTIKAGFAHKRKMAIGNLKKTFPENKNIEKIFEENKIPLKARAEDISLENWALIAKYLKQS